MGEHVGLSHFLPQASQPTWPLPATLLEPIGSTGGGTGQESGMTCLNSCFGMSGAWGSELEAKTENLSNYGPNHIQRPRG